MEDQSYTGELLRTIISELRERLLGVSESRSEVKPAPEKWSPKEVIGHLIDSAANNHQRFVRTQFQDNMIFQGYDQDAWVAVQNYQGHTWKDLVNLWYYYNWHLSQVMDAVPDEIRYREFENHNLHEMAYIKIDKEKPAMLEYFMQDYIRHLEHHIQQIFANYEKKST
ncbi:DinB family protein [Flexithrix dorotheae]|uniref:DinB family protein n=1 Tax=Flexithrix dorotheae TaxID=70993 RepID=UPI00037CCECB|nr:DinB family protein [Flexithrix dorotheae]